MFHKLQCLGHFKLVDMSERYNHTLLDIVWSGLSLTELRYYYLELLVEISKHSLQYREPSEFVETTP